MILRVDSGLAGVVAELFALRIFGVIFPGNVGGKGVRWLAGYFIVKYTIWLASVKRFVVVPFREFGRAVESSRSTEIQNQQR